MRGLAKFWANYLFNHVIATQILHHNGSWNLFYGYPLWFERYSETRAARDIEILELEIEESKNDSATQQV